MHVKLKATRRHAPLHERTVFILQGRKRKEETKMKKPFTTTVLAFVLTVLMLLATPASAVSAANNNKQPASGAAQNPCTQHVSFHGIEFDIPPYFTSMSGYDKMIHGWCDSRNLFFVLEDGSSATNGYSFLHIGVSDLTMTDQEYEDALTDTINTILGYYPDVVYYGLCEATLGRLPALGVVFDYTDPSTGVLMEAMTVFCYTASSGREYSFTYAESQDTYFTGWDDFLAILASSYLSENPPKREAPITGDTIRPSFQTLMKPYEDYIASLGEEYEDLNSFGIGYNAVLYFGYLNNLNEDYNYFMNNYGATHAETAYYNSIKSQFVDVGVRFGITSFFELFDE